MNGRNRALRCKVLRIKVKPDGSYGIPAGNLFPEYHAALGHLPRFGCDAAVALGQGDIYVIQARAGCAQRRMRG